MKKIPKGAKIKSNYCCICGEKITGGICSSYTGKGYCSKHTRYYGREVRKSEEIDRL